MNNHRFTSSLRALNTMQNDTYTPISIAKSVLDYNGFQRKQAIGNLVKILHIENPEVIADFGEDAAVIQQGKTALLLASDGIWSQLMDKDPYWAGYCAVLVNIHDVAAMGGKPLALVDVLSTRDNEILKKVANGMHKAATTFNVPIVGGHLHPDAPYNVIDVAILGTTELENVIYSSQAKPGNVILAAFDLNGRVHPSVPLNWDSVTMKSPELLQKQLSIMKTIGEKKLLTAGKDISNPGIIGTLGMLLESSNVGGILDLTAIPHPDFEENNITFEQWVRMYPGMGFIMTAKPEMTTRICKYFSNVNMECREIGVVTDTKELILTKGTEKITVFDFTKTGITNI